MLKAQHDFSWDQLARRTIYNGTIHGDGNLQAYWRRDQVSGSMRTDDALKEAGELVQDEAGKNWHLVHASAELQAPRLALLNELVSARLVQAKETRAGHLCESLEADGRAQLQGAMLLHLSALLQERTEPLHIVASDATFPAWRAHGVTFSPGATFERAHFAGRVRFNLCDFTGSCCFNDAQFSGDLDFGGSRFSDDAWLHRLVVTGEADFSRTGFLGMAHFLRARFRSVTRFDDSKFEGGADFKHSFFEEMASFDDARFEVDGRSGRVNFRDATFRSTTKFFRVTFPSRLDHFGNAFSGTRFRDFVDFTGAKTHWVAALNDAVFEKAVSLPRPSDAEANQEFRQVILKAVDTAVAEDIKREPKNSAMQHRTWRLEQIEGGCRNLKNVFGRDRDEILEQRYYRFQLIARRKQTATPKLEKLFSVLYGWTSNYGASIGQPFVSIVLVILGFAAAYWLLEIGLMHSGAACPAPAQGQIDEPFSRALEFSLSRVFPFGAFEDVSKRWIADFDCAVDHKELLITLGVRVLASVQSVIALGLVFVFGLTIRRKFQMN